MKNGLTSILLGTAFVVGLVSTPLEARDASDKNVPAYMKINDPFLGADPLVKLNNSFQYTWNDKDTYSAISNRVSLIDASITAHPEAFRIIGSYIGQLQGSLKDLYGKKYDDLGKKLEELSKKNATNKVTFTSNPALSATETRHQK